MIFLLSAAGIAALMLIVWLVSLRLEDASIVDPVWPLGFMLVAWIGFAIGEGEPGRKWLLAILVTVWGLRLSGYLFKRNLGHGEEDYRYQAMRRKHGDRFPLVSLYTVFGLQGLLMFVVSLPLQVGMEIDGALGIFDIFGVIAWMVGFFFESVGDAQLARFKADPTNDGRVMDQGLWRYTRHPNYFGDFMVWWGHFLIAASVGWAGWATFVGPVVMSVLLMRVSGAKLLEKGLKRRRHGYEDYIARTSEFFPRRPRAGL